MSGTDADLRKLSKEKIHTILRELGYTENVESIDRWQGVNIIWDKFSERAEFFKDFTGKEYAWN